MYYRELYFIIRLGKELINIKKVVFLLAIVLVLAGCSSSGSDSLANFPSGITVNTARITITGLDDYNGKYIVGGDGVLIFDVDMELLPPDDWIGLFAAAAFDLDALTFTGRRVNNGSVTLNVWQANYDEENDDFTLTPFTGNGFAVIALHVSDSPVFSDDDFDYDYMVGFVFPKLNNGVGSGQVTLDIPPEWEFVFSGGETHEMETH